MGQGATSSRRMCRLGVELIELDWGQVGQVAVGVELECGWDAARVGFGISLCRNYCSQCSKLRSE